MEIREHLDTSFDCFFEEKDDDESNLTWFPWVGKNFKNNEKKILIIGESHYSDKKDKESIKEDVREMLNNRNFTRDDVVFNHVINTELVEIEFFKNLHKTLFRTNDFDYSKLWQEISFYNFIQRPMTDISERPGKHDIISGWKTFMKISKILKPSLCIFIGVAASNYYNKFFSNYRVPHSELLYGDKINSTYERKPVTIELDSKNKAVILFIKHASKYFSWEEWYKFLNDKNYKEINDLKNKFNNLKINDNFVVVTTEMVKKYNLDTYPWNLKAYYTAGQPRIIDEITYKKLKS